MKTFLSLEPPLTFSILATSPAPLFPWKGSHCLLLQVGGCQLMLDPQGGHLAARRCCLMLNSWHGEMCLTLGVPSLIHAEVKFTQ